MPSRNIRTFPLSQSCEIERTIHAVAVLPNKRHFLSGESILKTDSRVSEYAVKLWDIETGICLRTFLMPTDSGALSTILVFNNESFLCKCTWVVLIFNLSTGECIRSFDAAVSQLQVVDNYRFVATEDMGYTGRVAIWNVETGECEKSLSVIIPNGIDVIDNETVFVIVDDRYNAVTWNFETNRVEQEWANNDRFIEEFVDRQSFICTSWSRASGFARTVSLVKMENGEEQIVWSHDFVSSEFPHRILGIGGQRMYRCRLQPPKVILYKVETGQRLVFDANINVHRPRLVLVDNYRLLIYSEDNSITLWDFSNWREVKHLFLLRKLHNQGRATIKARPWKRHRTTQSGRASLSSDSVVEDTICSAPQEIFCHVVSYLLDGHETHAAL